MKKYFLNRKKASLISKKTIYQENICALKLKIKNYLINVLNVNKFEKISSLRAL